jgi:hypothetical protein
MQNSNFWEPFDLMNIDEVYLMKNWKKFRSRKVESIAKHIIRIISFFIISTRFENHLTSELIDILRLNDNVIIIKKLMNQKDLFLNV